MALDTYASYNVNIFHLNLSVNRNLNPCVTGILISIHWKFQASIAGLWVKIYSITIHDVFHTIIMKYKIVTQSHILKQLKTCQFYLWKKNFTKKMSRDVFANTAPPTMQIPRHTNRTMEQYRYLYQKSWSPFKNACFTMVPVKIGINY